MTQSEETGGVIYANSCVKNEGWEDWPMSVNFL
jgi:hypothetical protein